eukprot:TRINITY_DN1168_c0_g1_i2.p1 TRINITY_DN1168_c0_g1~~TRINITY_DN1168_c0_g1_i2.p1  ORF type:complete len:377 (+),score=27.62 TRINITY_DN1168_c0_g1_i2:56-1186(+)
MSSTTEAGAQSSAACAPAPAVNMPVWGKPVRFAMATAAGIGIGCAALMVSKQGRLRPPSAPVLDAQVDRLTGLPAELPRFPLAFPIPGDGKCGAAHCGVGGLCCPGGPGYGFTCGSPDAVCCQGFLFCEDGSPAQVGVSLVCAAGGVCCRNGGGNPYCCAAGNQCQSEVCVAGDGQCFPGRSMVHTLQRGSTRLEQLDFNDDVLVQEPSGTFVYGPVVAFLHKSAISPSSYINIIHEKGVFRASGNHLIFASRDDIPNAAIRAEDMQIGDRLVLSPTESLEGLTEGSQVLCIGRAQDDSGMYAPFAASGKVVVDGVVASAYALPSTTFSVTHATLHAAWYFVRVYLMWPRLLSLHQIAITSTMFVLSHDSVPKLAS